MYYLCQSFGTVPICPNKQSLFKISRTRFCVFESSTNSVYKRKKFNRFISLTTPEIAESMSLIWLNSSVFIYFYFACSVIFAEFIAGSYGEETFDYIIVGGGSAGAVLTNRLSEKPNVKVLLIEAGGDPTNNQNVEMPLMCTTLQKTEFDWQSITEPQHNACFGLIDRKSVWPHGKALGGTSNFNNMAYVRGNKEDFNKWKALGNFGWGYEDVLPYFKKSEDNQNPKFVKTPYHRAGGLLTVSDSSFVTPIGHAFLKAANMVDGYPIKDDINAGNQTGVVLMQATTRRGTRCSANKAFIQPAKNRPNLTIKTYSLATKIIFDNRKRAVGVLYDNANTSSNGIPRFARARKEVIVSAGAIGSPHLLLLSGIGPKKELKKFKDIRVIANLPGVGKNLQDHIQIAGLSWTINKPYSIKASRIIPQDILTWKTNGTGIITNLCGADGLGFINTKYADPSGSIPDIEIHVVATSLAADDGATRHLVGLNDETWTKYYKIYGSNDTFSLYPVLLRPKSRGKISLRDTNPKSQPIIDPAYLSNHDDVKVLVAGIKKVLKYGNSAAFKSMGAKFFATVQPGCERLVLYSDAYWECLARHQTMGTSHIVGTCKMGRKKDVMAVVDRKLRVRKVKRLRVVDASIMPLITSGNTNAPIIMIGEKAADYIKASNRVMFYKT